MTDTEKLALFDWIQDHEASDGVITRRLAWANEAEKVLRRAQEATKQAYHLGFIDALTCFAHWKDGVQYVGTCGATLRGAIETLDRNPYYTPPSLPTPPPCMGRAIVEARKA